jgi:hypothetical protein
MSSEAGGGTQRFQAFSPERGQTAVDRSPDRAQIDPLVIMAQHVAETAHCIHWRLRQNGCHALWPNLDHRLSKALQTSFHRANCAAISLERGLSQPGNVASNPVNPALRSISSMIS